MEAIELFYNFILKNELARRIEQNPQYSLNSFARTLGVSPATLSLVLNNKQPLSLKNANKILKVIELS